MKELFKIIVTLVPKRFSRTCKRVKNLVQSTGPKIVSISPRNITSYRNALSFSIAQFRILDGFGNFLLILPRKETSPPILGQPAGFGQGLRDWDMQGLRIELQSILTRFCVLALSIPVANSLILLPFVIVHACLDCLPEMPDEIQASGSRVGQANQVPKMWSQFSDPSNYGPKAACAFPAKRKSQPTTKRERVGSIWNRWPNKTPGRYFFCTAAAAASESAWEFCARRSRLRRRRARTSGSPGRRGKWFRWHGVNSGQPIRP